MSLSRSNYYRKLMDIIIVELKMDAYPNLYDPEIYGYNREQKMVILIQQIMHHSMFNNDIENRYNTTIDIKITPRDATHYINSAKIEYTKLMNYVNHITNKTTKTHFMVTKYPTEDDPNPDIPFGQRSFASQHSEAINQENALRHCEKDDFGMSNAALPLRLAKPSSAELDTRFDTRTGFVGSESNEKELNKYTVTNIKRVREQIEEIQQKIGNIKLIMSEFTDPKNNLIDHGEITSSRELVAELPRRPVDSEIPSSLFGTEDEFGQRSFASDFISMNIVSENITIVKDEIRFLENKIKCLKKMKEEYMIYDTLCIDLVKNEIFLKKHNLRYNLYLKTVNFDTTNVNNLPEDVINIIQEYIGVDHLTKIRQRCMSKKYFPNGREDMRTILKSWKKEDLYNYGQHTFLKYNINTDNRHYRFRKVWIVRSWTKDKMIDHITRNTMTYNFPEFQRDVYLITKILKEKRCKKKPPKKTLAV